MLLADAGMVEKNIATFLFPADEVGTLPVNVQDFKLLFSLEYIKPPHFLRNSGFRRLVVFDDDSIECVRMLGQLARLFKIRQFFFYRFSIFVQ